MRSFLLIIMAFTVYILYSRSCNKFYSGHTQDFENRFLEHNSGETTSIKHCVPWQLVWKIEIETRSEAMKLEAKIKKRGAKRFLSDFKYWNGIAWRVSRQGRQFESGRPDLKTSLFVRSFLLMQIRKGWSKSCYKALIFPFLILYRRIKFQCIIWV